MQRTTTPLAHQYTHTHQWNGHTPATLVQTLCTVRNGSNVEEKWVNFCPERVRTKVSMSSGVVSNFFWCREPQLWRTYMYASVCSFWYIGWPNSLSHWRNYEYVKATILWLCFNHHRTSITIHGSCNVILSWEGSFVSELGPIYAGPVLGAQSHTKSNVHKHSWQKERNFQELSHYSGFLTKPRGVTPRAGMMVRGKSADSV